MDENEKIILSIDNILNEASSLESKELKQKFFLQRIDAFKKIKNSLAEILELYQFREHGNIAQNHISDKLRNVIVEILKQKSLFENQPQFEYFIAELLDMLNYNENKFAFKLQFEKDINSVQVAIEYLQNRNMYLKILKENRNDYFQDDSLNGSAAREYCSSKYEENLLGHALIQIKENFLKLKKEDIINVIKNIDNSDFIDELIQKSEKQTDFYDENLIFQYTDTILKLKSIFIPETVKNDRFVQAMWNGKITNSKTIQSIVKNISVDTLDILLNYSSENLKTPFIFDLANHFKKVNYSDKDIATVINDVVSRNYLYHQVAKVLAKIDIPKDLMEFMNSKYSKEYSWLLEGNVFQSLKKMEKDIEDAKEPLLPTEYYIKKLDRVYQKSNIDKHFVQNLITLLHSDYYDEDEKMAITDALKRNGLYSRYIIDEKVTFEKNDSNVTTYKKILQAYFSGQVIPVDVSTSILNQLMIKPECQDTELNKKILEACVQSVISNQLAEKGIDIGNKVFFGNGYNKLGGYYQRTYKYIWVNENTISKFIDSNKFTDKAKLFKTMFHEMRHAEQFYKMDKGNIDYLTYNFIKEDVIGYYDENFYDNNYISMYIEADARKEGILGSLEFLKNLDTKFIREISSQAEEEYLEESVCYTIYRDSDKKMPIGRDSTKIDISDYVGRLIQSNPQILIKNPILTIEYNADGSRKNIETLIQDFEQRKPENSTDYSNIYSIYYGLISKAMEQSDIKSPEIQRKVSKFLEEQNELISLADMQVLYKKVSPTYIREVYSRLLSLTRNLAPIKSQTNKERSEG